MPTIDTHRSGQHATSGSILATQDTCSAVCRAIATHSSEGNPDLNAFHELLQQREQLVKLQIAYTAAAAAAAQLPLALRERIAEPVRDCDDGLRFVEQTFKDL